MQKIISFFREVRAEFKNITWPKKDTLIQLTIVVISISVIISLILGGFDYIFTTGLNYIGTKPVPQINTNILPTEIPLPAITVAPTKIINKK
jgi:preprotein translocase subunit SecE